MHERGSAHIVTIWHGRHLIVTLFVEDPCALFNMHRHGGRGPMNMADGMSGKPLWMHGVHKSGHVGVTI